MSISLTSIKCPDCGATLSIEDDREQVFCSYCGTKIIVTNENKFVFRNIDDAEIKRAETERILKLKELELTEQEKNSRNRVRLALIIFWISLCIISIVGFCFLVKNNEIFSPLYLIYIVLPVLIGGGYIVFVVVPDKEEEKRGGIRFPSSLKKITGINYYDVVDILEKSGFTNINCINLHDVKLGVFVREGKVSSITAAGIEQFSEKKFPFRKRVFLPDTSIVISYHGH